MSNNFLINIIQEYVSGDWGNEKQTENEQFAVSCIRGADIVPIENSNYKNIPIRYVSKRVIETKLLREGDIIIEKSGGSPTQSTGRVLYISKELIRSKKNIICSNFCVALRIKDDFNSKYIYYYFKHIYNCGAFFNFEGKTSGLKNLQLESALNSISIKSIPLNKQITIATCLTHIEEKIAINHSLNHNLEAMAKQLYDYWFVQFDFPNEEGKPYKSSGGKLVWNDIVQRKIPLDWDVSMLKNECSILLGGTPSTDNKNYWENGEIHWLNSGEVADFPIVTSEKMITQEGLNESSTILAPKGSVTLSITRYLRISILAIDACINQSVIAIRESCKLKNYYLYPFLVRAVPRFMKLRTGAQQPHINKETVEKSPIIIPTNEILDKYYEIISNVYETIINNALEIQKLTKLRDELLPLLMNGQVSVNYDL